jgi:pimeloyl-ACP methyl ester carboxylesterase
MQLAREYNDRAGVRSRHQHRNSHPFIQRSNRVAKGGDMKHRSATTNRGKSVFRLISTAILLAAGTTATDPETAPASAAGNGCRAVKIGVSTAAGQRADQVVSGTLCTPGRARGRGHAVDVLVHGGTYNRDYWDWPKRYPTYSYTRRTLNASRATFAYDRLGAGASSRPQSAEETITTEAYILHQIIGWLSRQHTFSSINLIGHSFGSVIAAREAGEYNDARRLVLTGYLHALGPAATDLSTVYPAYLDPRFAGRGYDPGWLTSVPGTRAGLFYSSIADPAIIASDEATKDVISSALFSEGLADLTTPAGSNPAGRFREPVLLVNGADDRIYCGTPLNCANPVAVRANEGPYFTAAASLTIAVVPRTGHDLALHPTAGLSFAIINSWLQG